MLVWLGLAGMRRDGTWRDPRMSALNTGRRLGSRQAKGIDPRRSCQHEVLYPTVLVPSRALVTQRGYRLL